MVVERALVFKSLVVLVACPLWVWRAAPCEDRKANAFRNVGSVIAGEDRIRQGYFNCLKVRFVKNFLVTDTIYLDTLDHLADRPLTAVGVYW